ncbi:MAG: ATP-binding cassette domain-containing protein [Gammaproteobacteria bacterium]|nr:ATP-binding cassette domain-containing protein [Gammaproteobacteria bacterium]MYI89909.1 ATP-binding cassette domain-containing protein [Gammaproteobacteria bacterium]
MSGKHQSVVAIEAVDFHFGQKKIYTNVTIQIPSHGVSVIMGPSGCGKSTLLNLISGRYKPDRGNIRVLGCEVNTLREKELFQLRRQMGMMFQSSALLTDLSVFENVAFPLRENTDLPEPLIRNLVLMKLEQVGLRGAQDLSPSELSGGMARRVALARATAMDPDLLLFDEPFTGLDPISLGIITKLVREITDALRTTSIVVTHDVEEGLSIADHVFLLGSGTLLASGTPQELLDSNQPEVRQFLHGLPDGPVPFHYPANDYRGQILEHG